MTPEERLFTDILLDCSKSIRINTKKLYNKNSKYYINRKVISKQNKYMQDYLIKQLNEDLEFINSSRCEYICNFTQINYDYYKYINLKNYNLIKENKKWKRELN